MEVCIFLYTYRSCPMSDASVAELAASIDDPFATEELATLKAARRDRKSTRLNSSHGYISYAVFCLKKKIKYIFGGTMYLRYATKRIWILHLFFFLIDHFTSCHVLTNFFLCVRLPFMWSYPFYIFVQLTLWYPHDHAERNAKNMDHEPGRFFDLLLHVQPGTHYFFSLCPFALYVVLSFVYFHSMVFFFNDTATTEIYTLSLHDALPISPVIPVTPLMTHGAPERHAVAIGMSASRGTSGSRSRTSSE